MKKSAAAMTSFSKIVIKATSQLAPTAEEIQKVFSGRGFKTEIITTQFGLKFVFISLNRKVTANEVFLAIIDSRIDGLVETKHLGSGTIAVYVPGSKV